MNGKFKERPTWLHLTAEVLPPIRLKHPLKQSSRQPHPQQTVGTTTGLCSHHGHSQMSCRLPPLDQHSLQTVQDMDGGINTNTSEISFDLHYGFETECDDTITEQERPKAPEPMILESISDYDLGELLGKDELPPLSCAPITPNKTCNNCQTVAANMDCLVLEDIDDSDNSIDDHIFITRCSDMFIVQSLSQEPLIDSFIDANQENHHSETAKAATTVSQKSIKSTKADSRSNSSRLRRFASSITRVMSNKFRKLCRTTRVEGLSTSKDNEKVNKNQDGVVDRSTSTNHLL